LQSASRVFGWTHPSLKVGCTNAHLHEGLKTRTIQRLPEV
jgi:hypothetical protein